MKRSILALTTCLIATPLWADEFRFDAKVTKAVVFPTGGVLTRSFDADIPAGQHALILRLPADIARSGVFRVVLPENSGLTLVSTSFRVDRQIPQKRVESPAVLAARAKLEEAEAALRAFGLSELEARSKKRSAELRLTYLNNIASGNSPLFGDETEPDAVQFGAYIETLGAQMAGAERDLVEAIAALETTANQRADLNADVELAEATLNAVRVPDIEMSELELTVNNPTSYSGQLGIDYLALGVSWGPEYEFDLRQSDDKGTLKIRRRARLQQATGEDWSDVDLTLSTAAILDQMDTQLPQQLLQFLFENQTRSDSFSELAASKTTRGLPIPAMVEEDAGMTWAAKGQTIEYSLKEPIDVRSDAAGSSLVAIDEISLDVDLFAKTNAAWDDKAYLYAELENTTGGNILAGPTQVYRDGAYMGSVQLPAITNGDKSDVSFGPLDGLLVERRTLSREDGDTGILTSSNARSLRFETKLTSLLSYPIALQLFDNVPVSESEDLKITEKFSQQPNERDVDGRRGVLRWDFDMKPGDINKLGTGYDMVWPSGQNIGSR